MTEKDKDRYKDTVFLPQTEFPMRGGLPQKEPELLAYWQKLDLYKQLRERGKGREKFTLHDGPPYANGNIHIGHATNKILKDVVVKCQTMLGKDAPYVPGWDCHGLPIEWKVEEEYRARGQNKDEVDTLKFRQECRDFAQKWVDVQRSEFQRLGIQGDWENPYLTMRHKSEADIAGEIHQFLMNGGLYKGVRPVMWSVVEKTALADAEVEYMEHKSPTIWVKFPIKSSPVKELEGASIVIWTTTPWTIPGNRAVAFGPEIEYGVYDTGSEKILLATTLAEAVRESAKIENLKLVTKLNGEKIAGTICRHPWHGRGYDFDVPALPAEFVTTDAGTGFVHIAPGHGEDDFYLGKKHNIEIPQTVGDDGVFYDHVPLLAGKRVLTPEGKDGDANGTAIKALIEAGALLAKGSVRHSYPHSWRSKAPLIFRTTSQWFISMEKNGLRDKALSEIEKTDWYPPRGQNRIAAMVKDRPDWCISRQRAWGVPIAMFVEKTSGEPLRDAAVNERIVKIFEQEGADAWYARPAQDFLGNQYKVEDYEQVMDIVDVWFESGSTHAFVMGGEQSDLYLEGSDQHRGWFQSSLLESVGTRGRAPFKAVLTHGFVLDEHGRKMSKSEGNVVAPQEICDQYGADILRLWVVNTDYTDDVRIGAEIMKRQADIYRRLRNTLRYLLGSLHGFTEAERVAEKDFPKMPELERWILSQMADLDAKLRRCIEGYEFRELYTLLHDFCAVELSAFYFDVRKDSLYCDAPESIKRRSARTVMDIAFNWLTAWLAPVLCFTAEEAWLARDGAKEKSPSVHLRVFSDAGVKADWNDPALNGKWARILQARGAVTAALEKERADKNIGSSLQAHPVIHVEDKSLYDILKNIDFAEICITSALSLKHGPVVSGDFMLESVPGFGIAAGLADGEKCARCWRILPDVGKSKDQPGTCTRCAEAVRSLAKAA